MIKELLKRVQADKEDKLAGNTANLLFETATLRSGFILKDSVDFASRIESMLKSSLSLSADEQVKFIYLLYLWALFFLIQLKSKASEELKT